jgi:hypothetical protein
VHFTPLNAFETPLSDDELDDVFLVLSNESAFMGKPLVAKSMSMTRLLRE